MSGLIWIQTVRHSNGIFLKDFFKKFELHVGVSDLGLNDGPSLKDLSFDEMVGA